MKVVVGYNLRASELIKETEKGYKVKFIGAKHSITDFRSFIKKGEVIYVGNLTEKLLGILVDYADSEKKQWKKIGDLKEEFRNESDDVRNQVNELQEVTK